MNKKNKENFLSNCDCQVQLRVTKFQPIPLLPGGFYQPLTITIALVTWDACISKQGWESLGS